MTLITGITGKSGTFFLKKMIEEKSNDNAEYRAIVRKSSNTEIMDGCGLILDKFYGDIDDKQFLGKCMDGVDTVLHIAGIGHSLSILEAAIEKGVNWVILVHTTGIYSKYKVAAINYMLIEKKISEMREKSGINVTILRPTMIYGNLNDGNISIFMRMVDKLRIFPVIEHGKYALQPVSAKDLGEAYYEILEKPEITMNKEYILSGKQPILLIDIFKTIAKYLGTKNEYISIPFSVAYYGAWIIYIISVGKIDYREKVQRMVESRAFSHEEATQDFGYSPMSFEEGIREEINEYRIQKHL
jgi:nucleoside-diphosphate-sugar epimerase